MDRAQWSMQWKLKDVSKLSIGCSKLTKRFSTTWSQAKWSSSLIHSDSQVTAIWNLSSRAILRAAIDADDSSSHKPHNSKSTRFWGIFPVCKLKATPQNFIWLQRGCRQHLWKRIGLVLCPLARSAIAANHSTDNSWCRLLSRWQTVRNSPIQKWREKLTWIKSKKSSRTYTSM